MKTPKLLRKLRGSNRLPRTGVQVENAFRTCLHRAAIEGVKHMRQEIKDKTLRVVDDPSLKADGTRKIIGTKTTEIEKDYWAYLDGFFARMEKHAPPEQLRDLDQFEIGRLEGACNVLIWVLTPEKYPLFPFGLVEDEELGP